VQINEARLDGGGRTEIDSRNVLPRPDTLDPRDKLAPRRSNARGLDTEGISSVQTQRSTAKIVARLKAIEENIGDLSKEVRKTSRADFWRLTDPLADMLDEIRECGRLIREQTHARVEIPRAWLGELALLLHGVGIIDGTAEVEPPVDLATRARLVESLREQLDLSA
jgi:hypothetical protein